MTPDSLESQISPSEPPQPKYFWDRLSYSALQKTAVVFCILLICLPIFIGLTVRPWIYWLKGEVGVKFLYYHIVGQYWYSTLYIISLIAMVCMLLIFVYKLRHRPFLRLGKQQNRWTAYWLPVNMLLLLIWSTISCLLGKNREWALWGDGFCHEGLLMFLFYGTFFVLASQFSLKQMRLAAEVFACVSTITGILVITQGQLIPGLFYVEDKYTVMFHNCNHYGYFTAICVPIVIGLILHDTHKSAVFSIFRILQLWLILNATAVNSTHGSFLGIFFALVCMNVFIFANQKSKRGRMIFLDVFFLCTFLFLNTECTLMEAFVYLFKQLFNLSSEADKTVAWDDVGHGRGFLWRLGLQFACEKPIFGYGGPGNLIEPYGAAGAALSSPHNDIILISASLGFPALAFYLSGLAGHLAGLVKILKKISIFEAAVIGAVGSYLISSLTGTSMYYTTPYYFMVLGFSYRIYRIHSDQQSKESAVSMEPVTENISESEPAPHMEADS